MTFSRAAAVPVFAAPALIISAETAMQPASAALIIFRNLFIVFLLAIHTLPIVASCKKAVIPADKPMRLVSVMVYL